MLRFAEEQKYEKENKLWLNHKNNNHLQLELTNGSFWPDIEMWKRLLHAWLPSNLQCLAIFWYKGTQRGHGQLDMQSRAECVAKDVQHTLHTLHTCQCECVTSQAGRMEAQQAKGAFNQLWSTTSVCFTVSFVFAFSITNNDTLFQFYPLHNST